MRKKEKEYRAPQRRDRKSPSDMVYWRSNKDRPQSAVYTEEEMKRAFDRGYNRGYDDGYDEGYTHALGDHEHNDRKAHDGHPHHMRWRGRKSLSWYWL